MQLFTERFGTIQINEDQIITFHQGIPGFEDIRTFVILPFENDIPFSYLQSVEDGNLAFIVADPFVFYKDYEFDLTAEAQEQLEIREQSEVLVLSIVTIMGDIRQATINLLGPIVMNTRLKIGAQIVLNNTKYQTKHPLLQNEFVAEGDGHVSIKP